MLKTRLGLALLGLVLPVAVLAQDAPSVCTAPVKADGVLAPWNSPAALTGDELAVGRATGLTLLPTPDVRYAAPPEKPGDAASFGGVSALTITEPGTYRAALATRGWIDIVGADGPIASTAHGHGPHCTGIRKLVDFPLTPGTYTLQIAANPERETRVLLARLP